MLVQKEQRNTQNASSLLVFYGVPFDHGFGQRQQNASLVRLGLTQVQKLPILSLISERTFRCSRVIVFEEYESV